MKAAIGRTVLYVLSASDCLLIDQSRLQAAEVLGVDRASIGNSVRPGDIVPAVIIRAWSDTCINAKALLDGSDSLWIMSRDLDAGKREGSWHWPEREDVTELRAESLLTPPIKNASGDVDQFGIPSKVPVEPLEDKVKRLASELASVRKHESHLIQERDRLIVDLERLRESNEAEKVHLNLMTADRDALRKQIKEAGSPEVQVLRVKKPNLIPSTENIAEIMHDAYILACGGQRALMWRGKRINPQHLDECIAWRDAAEAVYQRFALAF